MVVVQNNNGDEVTDGANEIALPDNEQMEFDADGAPLDVAADDAAEVALCEAASHMLQLLSVLLSLLQSGAWTIPQEALEAFR